MGEAMLTKVTNPAGPAAGTRWGLPAEMVLNAYLDTFASARTRHARERHLRAALRAFLDWAGARGAHALAADAVAEALRTPPAARA